MTVVVLVAAVVLVALVVARERRRWRQQRRWIEERERLETYGEHLAAANGHPRTGDVIVVPIDEGTP